MPFPVSVEVAADSKGTQLQNSLGSGDGPARAAPIHTIFHQVAARPLNDPRGDGKPFAQSLVVAHILRILLQVVGRVAHRLEPAAREVRSSRSRAHPGRDLPSWASLKEPKKPLLNPSFRFLRAEAAQGMSRFPQVLE